MTAIDKVRDAMETASRENWATIRELSQREDLTQTQVKKLVTALTAEGVSPDQLPAFRAVLAQAVELKQKAESIDADFDAQQVAANAALREYRAESQRITNERKAEDNRLSWEAVSFTRRRNSASAAAADLDKLQRRHWRLLGLAEPVEEIPPVPFCRVLAEPMPKRRDDQQADQPAAEASLEPDAVAEEVTADV